MIRRLMASSAVLALMTAGLTVAQAQTEPTETEQPAVIEQDVTTDQGAAATTEEPAADQDAAATTEEPAATDDAAATSTDAAASTDVAAEADANLTPEEPTIATAFIGQSVYSSEDPESDNIGEVKDLIISDDGMITHAVIGVGGFLGIGEKNVAVPFDELQVVEQEGDIRLIFASTREQLEAAEEFDRTAYDPRARFQEEQDLAAEVDTGAPVDTLAPAPTGDLAVTPETDAAATDDLAASTETDAAATDDMAASTETDAAATDDMAASTETDAAATDDLAASTETDAAATTDMAASTETDAAATADTAAAEAGFLSFEAAQVRASTMIGKEVFGADDESIGEVSDLVLQEDGETRAALIDVGGFLGVGEKEVAIPFSDIEVAQEGDEARLTIALTREELEQLPAFEDATIGSDQAATDAAAPADPSAPAETDIAVAPADGTDVAADTGADAEMTADASGSYELATQDISAEQLIGSAVYSPSEENLGEVGDVVFDQGGAIEAVVVDVGGFLGVGEKPVAVQFDALNVQKDVNGDVRLMVNATQEQLEAAPSYDETAAVEGEAAPVQ